MADSASNITSSDSGSGVPISLVLGSGGARGLAHIGVIRELERRGYRIESISGCSMGALVGGIYAAGKLDEFERWVLAVTKMDIVALLDIAWVSEGLVKGDKIMAALTDIVGDIMIESLPIKFTAVAADISLEKEVWINSGSLFEAIRASISLPMFFTPVKYKSSYLVDGGVLNPVPIAPTFNDDTQLTIAVNLGGRLEYVEPIETPVSDVDTAAADGLHVQVAAFIGKLAGAIGTNGANTGPAFYDVANQAFDSMQSTIARQKLAAYPPDYVIELPRNACGTLEFDRGAEMVELGRRRAVECLDKIP